MSVPERYTIGVDIGGTFTDVVMLSSNGEVTTGKAASTPDELADGVVEAIDDAATRARLSLHHVFERTHMVKHGSTVATNALLTRRGVRVGLITTHGFEDTPFIMRAVGRVDGLPAEQVRHMAAVTKPAPLVAPDLVRGVRERIDAAGRVVVPLNVGDVRNALRDLVDDEQVDALAVSFLHAWLNPAHEHAVRKLIISAYGPQAVHVSLGSDLSQVAGEYARTTTAVANAFVGPIVTGYLADLEARLRSYGFGGRLLLMQGNGGLVRPEQLMPISTVQSGPAGGMLAAAYLGGRLGHDRLITTDMGGTSFDVGMITGGRWRYAEEPIFERLRILQPIIDIQSIGAGGGTIARVDSATGRLLVGPDSAGARPGPACYGTGGAEPTVTDCDLVLGFLDPDYFLGGRRKLDSEAARLAIRERLADPLGMSVEDAAAGVVQIVNSKMSDLIRREAVRSGHDPKDYVLYAFGGAGPVHAIGYARDLGISQIVVFPVSAVLSAFGIAQADLIHTRLATRYHPLPVDPTVLNRDLAALEAALADELDPEELTGKVAIERHLTMRFRRQTTGEEIPLPWPTVTQERLDGLATRFVERYEELYGAGAAYHQAGIDITAIRIDAIGTVTKPPLAREPVVDQSPAPARKGTRCAMFDGPWLDAAVYDQTKLRAGMRIGAPAIVESPFTTVVLPPGTTTVVDSYRNLVITL